MQSDTPSGFALMFMAGQYRGGELPLPEGREVLVGRDETAELRMLEEGVSRVHAKVEASRGTVTIRDLSSTNGTYVNGARVTSQALRPGDMVVIGKSQLQVIMDPGWQT